MKVFDCQDMPDNVRKVFFEENCYSNDCAIVYDVEPVSYVDDLGEESNVYHTVVDTWLIANGATENETIVIKHWW